MRVIGHYKRSVYFDWLNSGSVHTSVLFLYHIGSTTPAEMNPLFAILVVCSIVLIIFLTLTIIAIWKRSRRKKPPVVKAHRRDSENTFQSTEATITKIDQNGLEEIGNPDVIPNKNGRLYVLFFGLCFI